MLIYIYIYICIYIQQREIRFMSSQYSNKITNEPE